MDSLATVNTVYSDVIELRNIRQQYGDKVIIDNLNLLVEDIPNRGQFVCLLGPSGCGKSTLLRYIAGLQAPTSGEVLLAGKQRTTNDHVGMIFQQYSSFPWLKVRDNVALPLRMQGAPETEVQEKVSAIMDACDITKKANDYAQYPTLSGGQLQRVAIARSLVYNPHLLLLDEPFGALDIRTRVHMQENLMLIWENLWKINTATTFMFVTHDISEAVFLATDIYIMAANPGRIVHHIPIQMNFSKSRAIKRDPVFMSYVYDIEDRMMALEK
jgi:NitT/TauT family transport system ATP-binding protein